MVASLNWAQLMLDVDSRANRLQKSRVVRTRDDRNYFLDLVCCDEIAKQFERALCERRLHPSARAAPSEWTHRIRFDGPRYRWIDDMERLLETVLTLRPVEFVDCSLALDWYMAPPDPDEPGSEWTHTTTGDLVYRKYFTNNEYQVSAAGKELSERLANVVQKHPRYAAAHAVLVVPGTKHTFGERLARSVASRTKKEKIEARCLATDHAEAKAGHASPDLEPYLVLGDVSGKAVIVVDDVFRSGRTMRGVAAAARSAGASDVLGLVACRTMRKS